MVILFMLFITSAIALLILRPKSRSVHWMELTIIGWLLGTGGYLLFLAKYGGFYSNVNAILFLTDDIRQILLYLPVNIDTISRIIVYGRSLFIFSLCSLAYYISGKPSSKSILWLYIINSVLSLVNAIVYDPNIYRHILSTFDRTALEWIAITTRGWLLIAFISVVYIIIAIYLKSTVPWIKRRLMNIMIGIISMIIFYFYLGFMGPLQVTDQRTYYFLYSDFSNFNPPISDAEWYIGIVFTGISCIAAIYSFSQYITVERDLDKDTLYLDLKFNTGKMGAKVFTHGIKNQLIMLQMLAKKILEQKEEMPAGEVRDNICNSASSIADITNGMLERINELSNTFNTFRLELKPVDINDIIKESLKKVKLLPDNVSINNKNPSDHIIVLADKRYLAEAVYNIIDNAIEAIVMADVKEGIINIKVKSEHKYCIIEVTDNGVGMADDQIKRIYDPFYTNKNTVTNWGVGLSYSQSVIRAHFGHIQVKSKLWEGSTFYIFLPIYA